MTVYVLYVEMLQKNDSFIKIFNSEESAMKNLEETVDSFLKFRDDLEAFMFGGICTVGKKGNMKLSEKNIAKLYITEEHVYEK